nr:hypothetical protein [Tanacetum cinerariifolium]
FWNTAVVKRTSDVTSQWKFLIHTILQSLSAKRTSWNEFSIAMASAVICLSKGQRFNFSRKKVGDLSTHAINYISPALTQKVFANMRRVEGIDCLPNEEIFIELARMGYEKPSAKLTFYKAFFSSQRTHKWYQSQKVFANMRRVRKGCSGVETPLFEGMLEAQQVDESAAELNDDDVSAAGVADEGAAKVNVDAVLAAVDEPSIPSPTPSTQPPPPSQDIPSTSQDAAISMDFLHNLLDTCTTLTRRGENLEQDKIAQALEITKLKQRVKKLERRNKLKVSKLRRLTKVGTTQRVDTSDDTVMDDVSKHGRIIADMDADVDVTLKDVTVDAETEESADVLGRQAESQAQIYQIVLEHADKVLSMQDDEVEPAKLQEVVEVVTNAKLITEEVTAAKEPKPLKKQAQIEQDKVNARELEAELNKNIDWDEVIDHVQRKEKEDNAVKRMDYFKGMSYDDIRPIFKKKFNSNKLDEEVTELKRHLQIVPNDEDDVYTEATPLAYKVLVVDYEIYTENNKPYYKIIRADGSLQLFLSFLSLLWNFNREDLEVLWELVKESSGVDAAEDFKENLLSD